MILNVVYNFTFVNEFNGIMGIVLRFTFIRLALKEFELYCLQA